MQVGGECEWEENASGRRMALAVADRALQNYDFQIVNTGIDRRSSMLRGGGQQQQQRRRRRSLAAQRAWGRKGGEGATGGRADGVGVEDGDGELGGGDGEQEGEKEEEEEEEKDGAGDGRPDVRPRDDDMDALASGLEALRFVLPSVRFGRGGRRGGLARS